MRASRRRLLQAMALCAIGSTGTVRSAGSRRIVGWLHYGMQQKDGFGKPVPHWITTSKEFAELALRKNVAFESRFCERDPARAAPLARELVAMNPAAICTMGMDEDMCAHGLFAATRRIPLVVVITDPVASGMAKSLSRPGGNVTGLAEDPAEDKQLSLLREVLPSLSRLAVLVPPGRPGMPLATDDPPICVKAQALGIQAQRHVIASAEDAARVFAALPPGGSTAAYLYWLLKNQAAMAAAALRHRIPTMSSINGLVEHGVLMSYQTYHKDGGPRFAHILELVLDGVDPGTIPFDLPHHSSFYVNQATAKALGITFPERVLLAADKVVG